MSKIKDTYNTLSNRKKGAIVVVSYIAAIILVVYLFNSFLFAPMRVIGDSMNPSLRDKDVVIINKIVYTFNDPERFDLVVFPYKYDTSTKYIKRVIGLPGETVEIKDSKIYINDELLVEYYGILGKDEDVKYANYGPVKLGEGDYFVLGDNRNHSDDSRSSDVGSIKRDTIIGKACFRVLPFSDIGSLRLQ